MTLSADELIAKARDQLQRGRLQEAHVTARAAVEAAADDPDAWLTLGHCCKRLEDHFGAAEGYRRVTELAPHYPGGWALLGLALTDGGDPEAAEEPLRTALKLGTENIQALIALAAHCEEIKDEEGEYAALARLGDLDAINSSALLNRLGNHYFKHGRHQDALRYYHRSASMREGSASLFNMGLVYNDPEVSQDVDAIDAWRLCELRYPGENSKIPQKIEAVLPRLLELRRRVLAHGDTVLEPENWFTNYINPFELLNVTAKDNELDTLDAKTIQKLKKQLLTEIDLEDGTISWMADHKIDRSRALAVCEELNDEKKKLNHWEVFQERWLLDFLTRGSHELFTIDPERSPIGVLETFASPNDTLRPWLSPMYARQYNTVLGKAIDACNLPLIEALFDGRRWVLPEHEDQCFETARRQVEQLLKPFNDAVEAAQSTKPKLADVDALTKGKAVAILNLLPHPFRDQQNAAVGCLRDLSIAAHNVHSDTPLATSILELTRRFQFKSTALNHQLAEDYKKLQELLREQKKHEAHLTSGKTDWKITQDFVQHGDRKVPVRKIQSMRWGAVTDQSGVEFVVGFMDDKADEVLFNWRTAKDLEAHQEHFGNLIKAAMMYVMPHVAERIQTRLQAGTPTFIGSCKLTKAGIEFEYSGWFTTKRVLVTWAHVEAKVANGQLIVLDRTTPKHHFKYEIRQVQNAVLLPFLADLLTETS
jgi:tetratricopeptide (TPR) repeat protein